MDRTLLTNLIESAKDVYPDSVIMQQVVVTQAILESALLTKPSKLATEYFNLFGIKGEGTRRSVMLNTHEWEKGRMVVVKQPFAVNDSWEASFKQHRKVLSLTRYRGCWSAKDVPTAFIELRKGGYATQPDYAQLLTGIWKKYVRQWFDEKSKN